MNKDDRKFISNEITSSEEGLRKEMRDLGGRLKGEMQNWRDGLRSEIKEVENKLVAEICYNGVLMERLQDDLKQIMEGQEFTHEGLHRIEERLNLNEVERIPLLWETVKGHSRRIKKLEKTRAN